MANVRRFFSYMRNKHVGVEDLEGNYFQVSTAVEDTFFAGNVAITVRFPELEITSIKANIKRSFNKECLQAIPILQKAVGLHIASGVTKKIDGLVGAAGGCTNLANLILEGCHVAVTRVRMHLRQQAESGELSDAQIKLRSAQLQLQQFPHLAHQCVVWSTAAVQRETPQIQDQVTASPALRLTGRTEMLRYSLSKFVGVSRLDENTFRVQSKLLSRSHDFTVEIEIRRPGFEIIAVNGRMERSPGEECKPAIPKLQEAVGVRIERGLTATIDRTVGRPGCPRMANLLLEGCHAFLQGTVLSLMEDFSRQGQTLSWDEYKKCWLESMPIMRNTCLAYSDTSPLVQKLGIKWK
jgi:hypothetical protein